MTSPQRSSAEYSTDPGDVAPGRPGRLARRRYPTGDPRRPLRVCRHPRPQAELTPSGAVPLCWRCGDPISWTDGPGRHGEGYWRHRPARRPLRVVHPTPTPELTLSEVPARTALARPQAVPSDAGDITHDITTPTGTAGVDDLDVAAAIAAHLSPRAAGAIADATAPASQALRASYLLDAIEKARACPMCASTFAGLVHRG